MNEIQLRIREIIAKESGVRIDEIKDTDELDGNLAMDSLDKVQALMDCEKEFNISITDEEFEEIKTVGEVIALVESKL